MKTYTTEERNEACAEIIGMALIPNPDFDEGSDTAFDALGEEPYLYVPANDPYEGAVIMPKSEWVPNENFNHLVDVAVYLDFQTISTDISTAFIEVSDKPIEQLNKEK